MARFLVVLFDPSDNTCLKKFARRDSEVDAILSHPWIADIYRAEYIDKYVRAEDSEAVQDNIFNVLGWVTACVNLDEEIMKDLNGGDSSVSSQTRLQ